MKDIYCLAIESSCDETSMSIIKNGTYEVATVVLSQIDIHALYGGVVPEIASRSHLENITIVLDEILKKAKMSLEDIDIIGVTYGDENNQIAKIEQRNYFKIGDVVEFFGPNLENTKMKIEKIIDDETGEEIAVARHPLQILRIEVPFKLSKDDMMRKVK